MVQVYTSITCVKCKVLKGLLTNAGIEYSEHLAINHIDELREAGFMSLPVMRTDDGQFLGFDDAVKYISDRR